MEVQSGFLSLDLLQTVPDVDERDADLVVLTRWRFEDDRARWPPDEGGHSPALAGV